MNIHSLTILSFFAVLCYSSFSHARADIFPVKQKLLGKSAYLPRVQSNPIVVDGPLITANSYQAIWTHPFIPKIYAYSRCPLGKFHGNLQTFRVFPPTDTQITRKPYKISCLTLVSFCAIILHGCTKK